MFNGNIREPEKEDIEQVEKIYDLYWSDTFRQNLSQKLEGFFKKSPDMVSQRFSYYVAEEGGEIVGVAGMRGAPDHMKQYARTENPIELYVLAVKHKRKGTGSALRSKMIEEAKKQGYKEALFYSGETHQDSWPFHDASGAERAGLAVAPNGEPGKIWRLDLR